MSEWDKLAVENLVEIGAIDPDMAVRISMFPWVSDGVTAWEFSAISVFNALARGNYRFAQAVLDLWWVPGDMPTVEVVAIQDLGRIAGSDIVMAWQAIGQPFMEPPFRQRDQYAIQSLSWMAEDPPGVTRGADRLELLERQPWFNDGIDDQEAALLYALGQSKREFEHALIDTHYVVSRPVALPLAGDIELVVIRHTPFPVDDHTFQAMEDGVRLVEKFVGAPFPVTDVMLLLTEPDIWNVGGGKSVISVAGGHEGSYIDALILMNNWESGPTASAIYHELAHHYHLRGPQWLREGVASFLEAYAISETTGESLAGRLANLEARECSKASLQQLIDGSGGSGCDYTLGERFVLGMYLALGKQPVAAAIRDMHEQSMRTVYLDEETIFHAFQSNVPSDKQEDFRTAYRSYHGGPLADQVITEAEDLQSLMALYNSAGGQSWKNNGYWSTVAPIGNWYGVATESRGRVRRLELADNQLSGSIPAQLGNLSDLNVLRLQVNSLSGRIPPELGNLSNLMVLNLEGNELSGEIPSDLAGMRSLLAFNLGNNQLTGSIPPALAGIGGLKQLVLENNQLSGPIPLELERLSQLELLALDGNRLTGTIPPELGSIATLRTLDLADNLLTGHIPPELAQLPGLDFLTLSGNLLTGCIPSALSGVRINDLDELGLPYCTQ